VAVAAEVAGNPGVLFLDDPMTDLEGPSALRLMRCVQVRTRPPWPCPHSPHAPWPLAHVP